MPSWPRWSVGGSPVVSKTCESTRMQASSRDDVLRSPPSTTGSSFGMRCCMNFTSAVASSRRMPSLLPALKCTLMTHRSRPFGNRIRAQAKSRLRWVSSSHSPDSAIVNRLMIPFGIPGPGSR